MVVKMHSDHGVDFGCDFDEILGPFCMILYLLIQYRKTADTVVYRWTASSTVVYELKHGINSISHVISRETVLTTVAAMLT